jgi:hypothetical protein
LNGRGNTSVIFAERQSSTRMRSHEFTANCEDPIILPEPILEFKAIRLFRLAVHFGGVEAKRIASTSPSVVRIRRIILSRHQTLDVAVLVNGLTVFVCVLVSLQDNRLVAYSAGDFLRRATSHSATPRRGTIRWRALNSTLCVRQRTHVRSSTANPLDRPLSGCMQARPDHWSFSVLFK